MMNQAFAKIKTSHGFTGDISGLQDYYSVWAHNYNHDLADQNWVSPEVTCDIVRAVATSYNPAVTTVLDAGCGTGLVGCGLKRRGFDVIDGIDLSEEMVKLARETGAYRYLQSNIDLNFQVPDTLDQRYDLVVSSGMFTHGHAMPAAILSLINCSRVGGLIVASTRASYAQSAGFEKFLIDKVLGTNAELLFCVRDARYIDEEGGHYWILKRLS